MALTQQIEVFEEGQLAAVPAPAPTSVPDGRPGHWRMALLLTSSALLSGIAVVLWNRRALEHMREAEAAAQKPPPPDEFI